MSDAEDFLDLVNRLGLSPENPTDGWKLAIAMFKHLRQARIKMKAGAKAAPEHLVDDMILMFGVYAAERDGRQGKRAIISDIAKANGWPTDASAISTLRTRYYRLMKADTPERDHVLALAKELLKTFVRN